MLATDHSGGPDADLNAKAQAVAAMFTSRRKQEEGKKEGAKEGVQRPVVAQRSAQGGKGITEEKIGAQMAFWPDEVAAMPTELTRTALFGLPADKPGSRRMLRAAKLDSRSDVEVLYTGEQLSAKDETCWLACLRIGRSAPIGQRVFLNLSDLLDEMGLANTGGIRGNRLSVKNRLDRLSAAHFKVNFKRNGKTYSVTTGMLKWGIEHETGEMYIRLDPDGATLFENMAYQPWEVRLSLKTDVAARLLSYLTGHEQGKQHVQSLKNLKAWCGYGGETRKFRAACFAALKELEDKGVLVEGSSQIVSGSSGEAVCWTRGRMAIEDKT